MPTRMRHIVRDERGASIVMALVFFLICAIIGSVVLTAASVEAKAAQTHKKLQQDEFTMQSAANLMAKQLGGRNVTYGENNVTINVSYDEKGKAVFDIDAVSQFTGSFWSSDRAQAIFAMRGGSAPYVVGDTPENRVQIQPPAGYSELGVVYAMITVDPDLNLKAELSLDPQLSSESPYNMTVSVQCIPTYNAEGQLVSFTYDDAVIEKTSGGE